MSLKVGNTLFSKAGLIGIDLANDGVEGDATTALTLVNYDINESGSCAERILDLLGIYVLTVRENDNVLESTCDVEDSVACRSDLHAACVTCTEEAVLGECLGISLIILVVTKHNVGTLNLNLTLAGVVCICNTALNDGKNGTNTLGNDVVIVVYRKDRSALGNTVTVKNLNADTVEEVCHLLIKRCATGNDHVKLTAEGRENHFFEETVEGLKTDLMAILVEYNKTLNKAGNELTLCIDALKNSSVECLNVKRNCYKVAGLMLCKLLENVLYTGGDVDITADAVLTKDGNRGAVGVMGGRTFIHLTEKSMKGITSARSLMKLRWESITPLP